MRPVRCAGVAFRLVVTSAALATSATGCSGLALDPPGEVIHARMDPEAGVLPMPTDIVRDDELGRLAIPLDVGDPTPAERELFEYLNTMDGWSTTMAATVEFSGPIAPGTLTADTVQVWRWRETPEPVEDVTIHLDASETRLTIDPPREGWDRGGRYAVVVRGGAAGVEGKRGETVLADAAFYFLRLTEPLDTGAHDRAFPGDTAAERHDKAVKLEEIRQDLAPMFDHFAARGVPRTEVAALWSFTITARTELETDKVSQRMPLPIDLLRDPATGRVDLPVALWDSAVVAAAKGSLAQLDGASVSADLLLGFTTPVDPATISADTVTLVRAEDGQPVAADVTLNPDGMHVAIDPHEILAEATRYAVYLSADIRDQAGQPIALMPAAVLMRAASPVFDAGASQVGAVEDADAAKIESVRAYTYPLVAKRDDVLAAWTFQTMTFQAPMDELLARPETTGVDPDPVYVRDQSPLQALGEFALGITSLGSVERVYHGTLASPQYLDRVTRGFRGDGGYEVGPVPFTFLVPKDTTGPVPVVIFTHGLTAERRTVLALGNALCARGFGVVAIDMPYHGERTSCYSEDEAREGIDPTTGEVKPLGKACVGDATCSEDGRCVLPDGSPGELARYPVVSMPSYSGTTFIELERIANTADHFRQGLIDLSALVRSLEQGDWQGVVGVSIDPGRIHYTGMSMGGLFGATFVANHPSIARTVLNVPGANAVQLFAESPVFKGRIDALLSREHTVRGEYEADKLLAAATWIMDRVDPQTFAPRLHPRPVLIQMATLDSVIPNAFTELLVGLAGVPKRDYVGSHAFINLPLEPAYWFGVNDMGDFLTGELTP